MSHSKGEWKRGPDAEGTIGVWLGDSHWVGWDIESTCDECFGNLQLIAAAPLMLNALTEGIGIHPTDDFATDLETIAHFIKMYHPLAALDLRRKAKAIRAALASAGHSVAAVKGESN